MSDAAGPDQISEEELEAYLGQLREAPLSDIVAQTIQMLLNAAQVKLGRPDGRALIDVIAAIRDAAGERLDQRLVGQVDDVLSQLRLAQVEAEQRDSSAPRADSEPVTPASPQGEPGPAPSGGQQGGSDAASKLWIPGQS